MGLGQLKRCRTNGVSLDDVHVFEDEGVQGGDQLSQVLGLRGDGSD